MIYSNVDFNVVYVDPSIETAGDGTTPATALADLPATAEEFVDDTCYLIRRTTEDHTCIIPNGSNSELKNILLLGMPTPSDLMYEFVPEVAKTAWGTDSPEYACIKSESSNGQFQLSNIKQFLLHRVYLFRDSIDANRYIFNFNGDDYSSNININNCKFGSRGIDLDKADYEGEPITSSRLKAYVYINYAHMLSIKNTIINYTVTGNTNDAHGICCRYAKFVFAEDVTVNAPMYYTSYEYRPLQLSEYTNEGIQAVLRNIHMKVFFNGTYENMPLLLTCYSYQHTIIDNITVSMADGIGDTRPVNLKLSSPMIYFRYLRDFAVKNITVNLPNLWRLESYGRILCFDDCYWSNDLPGCLKGIKDITITLAQTETEGIGPSNTYSEIQNSGRENFCAVELNFSNSDYYNSWKMVAVDNITILNPRGRSLYTYNLRLTNANLKGSAYFYNTLADINSLESWFPGHALSAYEASTIRVHDLQVNLENPSYIYANEPVVSSSYDDYSFVFADSCNASMQASVTQNNENYKPYLGFISNNEGEDGHFIHRSPNGICDTWNVHRKGGSSACLKLWNNTCDTTNMMVLGQVPFKGMQLLPTTTGRHILKMHVAWKGYPNSADIYRRFMLSATVGDKTYWSNLDGRWLDDAASVWVNDSDLTQKALEIPFDIPETTPVDIRLYFSWYSNNGFLYVDPDIQIIKEN